MRIKSIETFCNEFIGMVQIPDAHGWGVEISSRWLESAIYQISEKE